MNYYGYNDNRSVKVYIPEIMGSSFDVSHCRDCSHGSYHAHSGSAVVLKKRYELAGIFDVFEDLINKVADIIKKVVAKVKEIARKTIKSVIKGFPLMLKKLQRVAGNIMIYMNPNATLLMVGQSWKVTANLSKQVDRYTGGLITDYVNVTTLPGRVTKGNKIPKEELIRDAIFCVRVGAVIATGGTASSIIGASANQMQQGELGQSETGRILLTIAQVAAVAAASNQAWEEAVKKQSVNIAGQEATEKAVEETALGNTEAGRLLITATITAATSSVNGDSAKKAVEELGKKSSKEIATREIAQELNVPYADRIAKGLVNNIDKLGDLQNFDINKILEGVDVNKALDAVNKALEKMPDVFQNISETDFSKLMESVSKAAGKAIDDVPEALSQFIKESSEVPADLVKAVSQLSVPTKDQLKDFIKKLKEIKNDWMEFQQRVCFYQNEVNKYTGQMIPVQICKNALARLPESSGGRIRYIYYFDDGTMFGGPWEDSTGKLKLFAFVGLGLILMGSVGNKKKRDS